MFFDTHCHLNDERYCLATELELCRQARVCGGVIVGTTVADSRRALELAAQARQAGFAFGASVGVHPEEVATATDDWLEQLDELLAHPCCVALGEVGLDYHWEPYDADRQKAVLDAQLALARRHDKPVIFHLRDCHADFWRFMEEQAPLPGAVMHCFDGAADDAQKGLERGWYVGFTGAVTFKRADDLRAIAAQIPADRLLSETDCPYMTPVPYRGKENRPSLLPHVTACLAQVQGLPLEVMARQILANAAALFRMDVTSCSNFA